MSRAKPRSSIIWGADSQTLFYVRLDRNQRPLYVYRHRLGTPGKSDVLIYEEKDKGSISEGKLADFVLLADDPHTVTPDKIKDIRIVRTVAGGATMYQA